jgi:hypothetical protein
MAAFRDGIVTEDKADIISRAAHVLDPEQARAAEALVLGRAGTLTPGGLRSAIARAVMQVAPDKARKRREQAARDVRVERWAEDSGNAALVGRELPPAQVLAADQKINSWAKQLKKAGLDGSMDELRARAYLDILLGIDSRPAGPAGEDGAGSTGAGANARDGGGGPGDRGGGPDDRGGGPDGGPPAGAPVTGGMPAGFAGRVNLTAPLATMLDLADRPGEIPGIGPVDPALARDLARAAARDPRSTWCVTVTDAQGHAIGHGCAKPEPASRRTNTAKRQKPGPPDGYDPHGRTGNAGGTGNAGQARNRDGPRGSDQPPPRDRPGFTFTTVDHDGPPGGYGTWRLSTGISGQPDLIIAIGPLTTGGCDHQHQAKGHDPGVMLRHLTQVRHATCTRILGGKSNC